MRQHHDALICDLAEYYHIYNWREFPLEYVATLALGLCEESRTVRELTGQKVTQETLLIAAAVDRLSILAWQNTEDAYKGRNKPKSIVEELTKDRQRAKYQTFASGEDFKAAWERLAKG